MTESIEFITSSHDAGRRIDIAVTDQVSELSRSWAQQLIRDGHVLVDGSPVKASYRLAAGERVVVNHVPRRRISARPEDLPLTIVYADDDLAIIDKPAGLVVHPAPGHPGGTLANALAARFPESTQVGDEGRPGIVHRLDKGTSGLMVVALNAAAQSNIQRQIADRVATRKYIALVAGSVGPDEGVIDAPIGRDRTDRKRMAAHGAAARPARTSFRVLERLGRFTLIEATLHTGRTHQIRVHLAALGHPVAGDSIYRGPSIPGLRRQFLHAYSLAITSPNDGRLLSFLSSLPPELDFVLRSLGSSSSPFKT